jgi:hypothetical protein
MAKDDSVTVPGGRAFKGKEASGAKGFASNKASYAGAGKVKTDGGKAFRGAQGSGAKGFASNFKFMP